MKRHSILAALTLALIIGMFGSQVEQAADGPTIPEAAALPMNDTTERADCLYCSGEDNCLKVKLGYDDCPWKVLNGRHICYNPDDKPCNTGGSSTFGWVIY